jgi:hypothetical protein
MVMHLEDLVVYFRLVYSRKFIDLYEAQITSQIKLIRSSQASNDDKRMWSKEARQSLRYAFFLRYYASFESHLKVICERFAMDESLAVRLSNTSGDNFLNKTNKYLSRAVGCEPLDKHPLWNDVLSYQFIRNGILHNDGRVLGGNSIPQYVVQYCKQPSAGISLRPNGTIMLKRRFCYRAVRRMVRFLLDVYGRNKEVVDKFWRRLDAIEERLRAEGKLRSKPRSTRTEGPAAGNRLVGNSP